MIKRSITHWTAGGKRASALDKKHYNFLTEFDGTLVRGKHTIGDNITTSDGIYAAHTLKLNTGSMGLAMCGMRGAQESPFSPGPDPINEKQFEAHCELLARKHIQYRVPVTKTTCLTHAEVQPRLGVRQKGKWDITHLVFKPNLIGAYAVGDYMRSRVRHYVAKNGGIPEARKPTLKMGSRGNHVRNLQTQLRGIGYPLGTVDGHFGRLTQESVLAFQAENKLASDGIVGASTWKALEFARERPEREVSEQDLEDRGSQTIKKAKQAEKAISGVEVAAAGSIGLGGALEILGSAELAEGGIEAVIRLTEQYWPFLLAGFVIFIAARYGKKLLKDIREARVEDAQTGRNLSR